MPEIVTLDEILVETLATEPDQGFWRPGTFAGPYPSGAPAIFVDQAARMGASTAMLGCIGDDDFGRCVLDRLTRDGVDIAHIRAVPDVATGVAFVAYRRDGSRGFILRMGNSAAGQLSPGDIDAAVFDLTPAALIRGRVEEALQRHARAGGE